MESYEHLEDLVESVMAMAMDDDTSIPIAPPGLAPQPQPPSFIDSSASEVRADLWIFINEPGDFLGPFDPDNLLLMAGQCAWDEFPQDPNAYDIELLPLLQNANALEFAIDRQEENPNFPFNINFSPFNSNAATHSYKSRTKNVSSESVSHQLHSVFAVFLCSNSPESNPNCECRGISVFCERFHG